MPLLFQVTIKYEVVVEAVDDLDAESTARDEILEICGDMEPDKIACTKCITDARHLPGSWTVDCIPYGGDGNTEIGALLPPNTRNQPDKPR